MRTSTGGISVAGSVDATPATAPSRPAARANHSRPAAIEQRAERRGTRRAPIRPAIVPMRGRQEGQAEPHREPDRARGEGRVAEHALEHDALVAERHVQGAVDEERGEVDRRERPRSEQRERDERVLARRHEDRERDERDDADGDRGPGDRVLPFLLAAADEPERQAADREGRDDRAEPVEAAARSCRATRRRGGASPTARTPRTGTLMRNANRQPMVSTSRPPTSGPSRASAGRRRRPDAEGATALVPRLEGWVMSDSAPGTRSAPAAPCSRRNTTSHSRVGARPHRPDVDREARQPDGVDPPPAVVVGQGAGEDQQGGEDREIAADDVGLTLEDADDRRRAARARSAAARR